MSTACMDDWSAVQLRSLGGSHDRGRSAARAQIHVQAPARSRLRLTRRGRVVFAVLAVIPMVFGAALGVWGSGAASASGPGTSAHFEYVTVRSGQSLWTIAEKLAPNADPRDVIAGIVSLNDLHDATVLPGERLAVPAQYASAH